MPFLRLLLRNGCASGGTLSSYRKQGGQEPEILVLDDASSALDYRTDAQLRRALRGHYRNVTTILVAQRVSSIRHCDHILVLSDGQVIGSGTHQELMETCGEYRMIAQTQMGEEKEGA